MSVTLQNDITAALDSAIRVLVPAAAEGVDLGKSRQLFNEIQDGRNTIKLGSIHGEGEFQGYQAGENIPNQAVFEGAPITLYPQKKGGAKSFDFSTVEEVAAAQNGDLRQLADNWADGRERTRDKMCAYPIKNNSTIYDTKALFATDHPQMSKSGAGSTYSNLDATVVAVSTESVRTILKTMAETIAYGENGQPISNEATHLVVHNWEDFQELLAVLKSTQKAGGAQNDINTLNELGLTPLYWRELAPASGAARYMYAVNTRRGQNGLLYWDKAPFTIETWYDPKARTYWTSGGFEGVAAINNFRSICRKQVAS